MFGIDIQHIQLFLQAIVTCLFIGSFWLGFHNLQIFRQNHHANLLKIIMSDYMSLVQSDVFENYEKDLDEWKKQLIASELSPSKFYYDQLNNLSKIGHYFDHVGLLVNKKLIDFDLVFELLPFPYKFWEDTQEFRKVMQELTYSDFWNQFNYLHEQYMKERAKRDKPLKKEILFKTKL